MGKPKHTHTLSHKLFCFLGHTEWLGKNKSLDTSSFTSPKSAMKSAFMLQLAEHISLEMPTHTGKCSGVFRGIPGIFGGHLPIDMIGHKVLCHWRFLFFFVSFGFLCIIVAGVAKASITASVHLQLPFITTIFSPCCLSIICVILIQKREKINNTQKKRT